MFDATSEDRRSFPLSGYGGLGIIQETNSRRMNLDLWEFLKVTGMDSVTGATRANLEAKSAVPGGG